MGTAYNTVTLCQHCGRPIAGPTTWIGASPFHPECCRSPYASQPQPATTIHETLPKNRGEVVMDKELETLLEKSRSVKYSDDELEEHRIALAAANGHVTDSRITVDTMKATRTIMKAAEAARED